MSGTGSGGDRASLASGSFDPASAHRGRLALVSDVHANLHALEAVLAEIDEQGVDRIAFLGDAVGYNAQPAACLRRLHKRCSAIVVGNHDEALLHGGEQTFNPAARRGVRHARARLSEHERSILDGLPRQTETGDVHLVHGSPRRPTSEYVYPDTHPEALAEMVNHPTVHDAALVAMGHTHVPFVRELDEVTVVNAGSVGQPRDGDPRASWALVDRVEGRIEIRRTRYEVRAAAEAVEDVDRLPSRSARRLYAGR